MWVIQTVLFWEFLLWFARIFSNEYFSPNFSDLFEDTPTFRMVGFL